MRPFRLYLFDLVRRGGEENDFHLHTKAASRTHNLPLMPLLAGDNPISNTLPSKFLRLTDYQYFLLRQWARGLFYNEEMEGWPHPDPWQPYAGWVNRTGRDLDRGVLTNLLGGSFCPGGELGWIQRNPSVYREPYRLKADPDFYAFRQTAAQASSERGQVSVIAYGAETTAELSQDNDSDRGLQPGDLTKSMAAPPSTATWPTPRNAPAPWSAAASACAASRSRAAAGRSRRRTAPVSVPARSSTRPAAAPPSPDASAPAPSPSTASSASPAPTEAPPATLTRAASSRPSTTAGGTPPASPAASDWSS
jgi:hypothetical protein